MSLQCSGELTQLDAATFQCSNSWELVSASGSFDPATLDPVLIAGAVGAGFFSMTSLFVAIAGVRFLVESIKTFL